MKQIYIFLSLVCGLATVSAQKHDNLWLYGYFTNFPPPDGGCTLDFSEEPPISYIDPREMNLNVTVASICDSMGNLMFYTNGVYIANFSGELMGNGDSLNPSELTWDWPAGLPLFQSEIILPLPNSTSKYFLLHLKGDYDDSYPIIITTFNYSIIDMLENAGSGKVLVKNQELLTNQSLATLTAVKHANGRDWWVVISDALSHIYKTFLLNPNGLSISSIQEFSPEISEYTNGTIVFSQDGKKMARYEVPLQKALIYGFDRCTGLIDTPLVITIPANSIGGGVAFSPNSQYLYFSSAENIYQIDLLSSDITLSLETVAEYNGYADPLPATFLYMQLGPDGRIYLNTNNSAKVLHTIERPNEKGTACGVRQPGVHLATQNVFTSPHFPNYRLGPLDGSPCDTLGLDNHPLAGFRYEVDSTEPLLVEFIDNSFYEPTDWLWDFGGTGSSTEVDPVHTFPAPGTYTVCLTVSNQYDSDTFCREVVVGTVGVEEKKEENFVAIFPNPASTEIHLGLSFSGRGNGILSLYDATGRMAREWKVSAGQPAQSFQLGNLAEGMYFWKVVLENGKAQLGKLAIAH